MGKRQVAEPTAQDLDAGERTGVKHLDRTADALDRAIKKRDAAKEPRKEGKKKVKVHAKAKAKAKSGRGKKKPGPKEGYRKKDAGTYPNTRYLFDAVFSKNRKVTFEQMRREMKKYFPDYKGADSKRIFEVRKARFTKEGWNSKRWYNEKGKGKGKKGSGKSHKGGTS